VDKIFLYSALKLIRDSREIVFFNGPRTKQIFDASNSFPHLLLNGKAKVRNWSDLILKMNDSFLQTATTPSASSNVLSNYSYPAIHIHNEEKIGDLLLLVLEVWKKRNKIQFPRPEAPIFIEKSHFQHIVNLSPYKLVFTNTIDENWGFLSTQVNTRTTKWINMTNHLRIHYSNYQTIKDFLDSEKVTFDSISSMIFFRTIDFLCGVLFFNNYSC
jgi:hypothetical protein